MSNAEIGAKLRALRGEKSRAEVAAAVGVSVSALQMYENGARVPRDQTKMDLAVYFGATVEDIFFLAEDRTNRAAKNKEDTMGEKENPSCIKEKHRRMVNQNFLGGTKRYCEISYEIMDLERNGEEHPHKEARDDCN